MFTIYEKEYHMYFISWVCSENGKTTYKNGCFSTASTGELLALDVVNFAKNHNSDAAVLSIYKLD